MTTVSLLEVSSSLQDCLNNIGANVAYASDWNPLYQISWVKPYNLAIDVHPAAVIRPKSAEDVAAIVKCAVNNSVTVQARSGGHSYSNFAMGEGSIEVDLVTLQGYSMNETTWYATIGAGMNLGDVDTNLHKTGRAFAHGVCPGVGIGGHASIGGLGPMSRMWGTALDHTVEVEVVTADGTILRASENENSDLFFGLRGAGASFGIITELVMRTHPEPGDVVQFTFDFNFGVDPERLAGSFIQWQDLVADPTLDRRFGTEFIVSPLGATITGNFYGTQSEFNATGILQSLPENGTLVVTDWIGSMAALAQQEALYLSNIATWFYSKSLGFRQEDVLSSGSATELFQGLEAADKGTLLWFIIFNATGGAVADVPLNATGYAHRNKIMFYQSYAIDFLSLSSTTVSFLTDFHNQLVGFLPLNGTARGTYPGYVDLNITGVPQEQYWEGNLPALEAIKAAWDPNNIFRNPQSVQPAVS